MQAGQLRHRVNIQRKTDAQDDYGEPLDEWVDVWVAVPARIKDLSGREFWGAQQVQADVTTEILIHWREDITPMLRIVHQDAAHAGLSPPEYTVYDITSVIADPTNRRELKLMCTRRTNRGFRAGEEGPRNG